MELKMKNVLLVALVLVSSSAFATDFTCNGRAQDQDGNWQNAQISVSLDGNSVSIKETDNLQVGLDIDAFYNDSYRPTAKYAGYYGYDARQQTDAGWNRVLVIKPMADNAKAKAGSIILQGSMDEGGMAAHFDYCTRQ
jgi:hypothetical protein